MVLVLVRFQNVPLVYYIHNCMKRIRIGNVELRPISDNDKYQAEIRLWYSNCYYGHENDYIKVDDEYYRYKDNEHYFIHKSCFEHPESCYVVAFVTNNEEPNILSVCDRPWDLSEEDEKDFKRIIKMIYEKF